MEAPRRLTRSVVFAVLAGFFVMYGGIDLTSRVVHAYDATRSSEATLSGSAVSENVSALTALDSPTTKTYPVFSPERIQIPALNIDARVEWAGKNGAGNMAAPKGFDTTAWYKLGSKPGEAGNVVIAGHLNNSLGLSGVFEKLETLPLGSEVIISGEGKEIRYIVRKAAVYPVASAPAQSIFSTTGPSELILITCDGAWDAGVRSYDKRLILTADPL